MLATTFSISGTSSGSLLKLACFHCVARCNWNLSVIPSRRRDLNHGLLRQNRFEYAQVVAAENQGDFRFFVAVFLQTVD